MSRSSTVTIVVAVELATEEFDADYTIVDIHGGQPAGVVERVGLLQVEQRSVSSDADWVRSYLDCGSSVWEGLFSESKPPAELEGATKFLVRGHIEGQHCGEWGCDYDEWFVVEEVRVLSKVAA